MMKVDYHQPNETQFRDVVRDIFQTNGNPAYNQETILPKGCTEIIFDLSESDKITATMGDKAGEVLPKCFVYSFTRRPIYVRLPKQQTYLGISLHPTVVKSLVGAPASEFTNRWTDLTEVDASFRLLWEQLAEQKTFMARVEFIKKWIGRKVNVVQKQEQLLQNFLAQPLDRPMSVPEVAEVLCYSPRHLARKFLDATGMNTEEVLLYKKYLQSLHLMHQSKQSLTEVAHVCHFTDQSHFINSFKAFTNLTPGEYIQLKNHLQPGHIFG